MKKDGENNRHVTVPLAREELELLMGCIGGSPIPAFVIDRHHRLIYWNRALEELSKISAAEVIGTNQHWRAFYSSQRPCLADLLVEGAVADITHWYEGKYLNPPHCGRLRSDGLFPRTGGEGPLAPFHRRPSPGSSGTGPGGRGNLGRHHGTQGGGGGPPEGP